MEISDSLRVTIKMCKMIANVTVNVHSSVAVCFFTINIVYHRYSLRKNIQRNNLYKM